MEHLQTFMMILIPLTLLAAVSFLQIRHERRTQNVWRWVVSTFNRRTGFKYARTTVVQEWPELPEDLVDLFHKFMERATIILGGHITPSDNSRRLFRKERLSLVAIQRLRLALKFIDNEFYVEKKYQTLLPYRNDMDAALSKAEFAAESLALTMTSPVGRTEKGPANSDLAIAKVTLKIAKLSAFAATASAIAALIQAIR